MSKGPLVRKRPRARNKDGKWRKKRSDAGKKREKKMRRDTRDRKFANFAHILYMECTAIYQEALIRGDNYADQHVIQHIARRAYDLVEHTLDHAPCREWALPCQGSDKVDLTELPKEDTKNLPAIKRMKERENEKNE